MPGAGVTVDRWRVCALETNPGYMCKRAKSQHWENIANAGSGKTGSLTTSVNVEKRSRGMKAHANKSCAPR